MANETSIRLWPGTAPGATGEESTDIPALTVHLPDPAHATGTGIIVNPGGGYRILASDHEGLQVARWLNRMGIVAFVLRYRVGPKYDTGVSLLDAQRAIRTVRARAHEFGLSPSRIGILGFSAGGHLAAATGTRFESGRAEAGDPVERASSRPDFVVPVYAVTNGERRGRKADEYTPVDTRVTATTPPMFLMHTHEDGIVPSDQSLLLYQALTAHGIQAELHVFGHGEHGIGLAAGDPDVAHWAPLMFRWLRRCCLLTDGSRIRVEGKVTLAGEALGMFWVTFIPEDPVAPIARTRGTREGGGRFTIPRAMGPIAGTHQLEVHHISDIYPHDATGRYSLDDAVCYRLSVEVRESTPIVVELDGIVPIASSAVAAMS